MKLTLHDTETGTTISTNKEVICFFSYDVQNIVKYQKHVRHADLLK